MTSHTPLICLVSTNADLAGAPLHVARIVEGLRDRFHFVVVFGEHGPVAQRLHDLGVNVHIIETMRSEINPIKDIATIVSLTRLIRRLRPDVVHAHSTKAGMVARIAAALCGAPVIFSVHGWGWRGLSYTKNKIITAIEWLLYRTIPKSTLLFVSESVRKEGSKYIGLPDRAGIVVHNGVRDLYRPNFRDRRSNVFLMAARVDRLKDHETICKAFNLLDHEAQLWLCGKGTEQQSFQNKVKQYCSTNFSRIRFLGEQNDMQSLYDQASVYCLISNFEALPLSIIEAMSSRLPVIASDVGGVSELITHGVNGLLVPKGDVNAVMVAMETLKDSSVRATMSLNARHRYETHFSDTKMLRRLEEIYLKTSRS